MKCVVITVTYMVELQDRVLVPWGLSSISAVAEFVLCVYNAKTSRRAKFIFVAVLQSIGKIVTSRLKHFF